MYIAKEELNQVKIVSFDMFDTLIHRMVKKPEDIFEVVSRRFLEQYHKKIDFLVLRIKAEQQARKKYTYHEVSLEEIYLELEEYVGKEDALRLLELECEAEVDFCIPNMEVYEIYKQALDLNKRIIVITDMYQNVQTLSRMLYKCGYEHIDKIYISGSYHKTKQSGALFDVVLHEEGIEPQYVFHIGDNQRADFQMPKKYGIHSKHYISSKQDGYYTVKNHLLSADTDDITIGYVQQIVKYQRNAGKTESYHLGYEVFGPLLLGILQWIQQHVIEHNVQKMLFFSRDGYILHKAFSKFKLFDAIEYFYISRQSVISALISETDSIRDAFARYRSWPYAFTKEFALSKLGIVYSCEDKDEIISFDSMMSNEEFLTSLRDIFLEKKESSKLIHDSFKAYVETALKDIERVGIVDIGGNQTIERAWREFINKNVENIHTISFNILLGNRETSESFAYLFDSKKNTNIAKVIYKLYYFLEIFLTAPHGSVATYTANREKPYVLEDYEYEDDREACQRVIELQEGAMEFVAHAIPLARKYSLNISPYVAVNNLINFGLDPKEKDLLMWKDFRFDANQLQPLVSTRSIGHYIFHWNHFIEDYRKSLWKGGFIANYISIPWIRKYIYKYILRSMN